MHRVKANLFILHSYLYIILLARIRGSVATVSENLCWFWRVFFKALLELSLIASRCAKHCRKGSILLCNSVPPTFVECDLQIKINKKTDGFKHWDPSPSGKRLPSAHTFQDLETQQVSQAGALVPAMA